MENTLEEQKYGLVGREGGGGKIRFEARYALKIN
jgi:hypothetical protein